MRTSTKVFWFIQFVVVVALLWSFQDLPIYVSEQDKRNCMHTQQADGWSCSYAAIRERKRLLGSDVHRP